MEWLNLRSNFSMNICVAGRRRTDCFKYKTETQTELGGTNGKLLRGVAVLFLFSIRFMKFHKNLNSMFVQLVKYLALSTLNRFIIFNFQIFPTWLFNIKGSKESK